MAEADARRAGATEAKALAATPEPVFIESLHSIAREVRSLLNAHVAVATYLPDGDVHRAVRAVSVASGRPYAAAHEFVPAGDSACARVLKIGGPLSLTADELDARPGFSPFAKANAEALQERPPLCGLLAVPVRHAHNTLGVIEVWDSAAGAFTSLDEQRLRWTAKLVAPTFQLERLAQELLAETALRRQMEERYRDLYEYSPDMHCSVLANGCVKLCNQTLAARTGYAKSELIDRPVADLYHPDCRDKARRTFAAFTATGFVTNAELQLQCKDGTTIDVLLNATAVRDEHGALVQSRSVLTDISERLVLQRQLRAAQRMEAVGRLAGGIAHDFNNVLTVIHSYVGFVRDQFREGDPARADLEAALEAAERAGRLTNQLLAFSRRQIQDLKVVDLSQTVTEIESMLNRLIGEDIDLVARLEPKLGLVSVDVSHMEQVLMNLAVNARDAMPDGGTLTIETRNVTIDEGYADAKGVEIAPGEYVMLGLSDTGGGMDEATRLRAFEPFFTTKGTAGTGLGLSTVYGIVKQSGGYIWIYSELTQGTTFKIYLPRVAAERASETTSLPRVSPPGGAETVLLVEDDEMLRKAGVRVLSRAGYTVLSAAHGGDALLLSETHAGQIDLMITDVVMPNMSGREVANRLAITRPHMKIIFTSGYTDSAIVQRGVLDAGVNFLQKPFAPDDLLAKLRDVLDRKAGDPTA